MHIANMCMQISSTRHQADSHAPAYITAMCQQITKHATQMCHELAMDNNAYSKDV